MEEQALAFVSEAITVKLGKGFFNVDNFGDAVVFNFFRDAAMLNFFCNGVAKLYFDDVAWRNFFDVEVAKLNFFRSASWRVTLLFLLVRFFSASIIGGSTSAEMLPSSTS